MGIFPDEMILFPLEKKIKMLEAPFDLSGPTLSPTKRLCKAKAVRALASPRERNPRRCKARLGLLFGCAREGGRALASQAARQRCSASSRRRGRGVESTSTPTKKKKKKPSRIDVIFAT